VTSGFESWQVLCHSNLYVKLPIIVIYGMIVCLLFFISGLSGEGAFPNRARLNLISKAAHQQRHYIINYYYPPKSESLLSQSAQHKDDMTP